MRTATRKASRKPKPKPEPAAVQPISAQDVPDWVNVTPEGPRYDLAMWEGADAAQFLHLTRDEFIMLKRFLAASRGHELLRPLTDFENSNGEHDKTCITQEEIQMLIDGENILSHLSSNIRWRLRQGAAVEPGHWALSSDSSEIDEPGMLTRLEGSTREGLTIRYSGSVQPS